MPLACASGMLGEEARQLFVAARKVAVWTVTCDGMPAIWPPVTSTSPFASTLAIWLSRPGVRSGAPSHTFAVGS